MPGITPKRSGEIVQERPGGGHSRRQIAHTESVERVDLEVGDQQLRRRHRIEEVGLDLFGRRKAKREVAKKILFPLGHENLGRSRADHFVEQGVEGGEFGHPELPGAEIGAGKSKGTARLRGREDGGGEVVTLLLETGILQRPRTHDPSDLAADKFPRLHFPHLLAESDAATGGEELFHVAPRGVVGNAAHRHLAPLRQRHVQDRRGLLGIVEEHLVKIPEPEEQESPRRQITPQGVILLHHRCSFGGHENGVWAEG